MHFREHHPHSHRDPGHVHVSATHLIHSQRPSHISLDIGPRKNASLAASGGGTGSPPAPIKRDRPPPPLHGRGQLTPKSPAWAYRPVIHVALPLLCRDTETPSIRVCLTGRHHHQQPRVSCLADITPTFLHARGPTLPHLHSGRKHSGARLGQSSQSNILVRCRDHPPGT